MRRVWRQYAIPTCDMRPCIVPHNAAADQETSRSGPRSSTTFEKLIYSDLQNPPFVLTLLASFMCGLEKEEMQGEHRACPGRSMYQNVSISQSTSTVFPSGDALVGGASSFGASSVLAGSALFSSLGGSAGFGFGSFKISSANLASS